jgi:hypothetical protein
VCATRRCWAPGIKLVIGKAVKCFGRVFRTWFRIVHFTKIKVHCTQIVLLYVGKCLCWVPGRALKWAFVRIFFLSAKTTEPSTQTTRHFWTFHPTKLHHTRNVNWRSYFLFLKKSYFIFLNSLISKWHFANATVNRERRFRALVLQNHPKSIGHLSILKIIKSALQNVISPIWMLKISKEWN